MADSFYIRIRGEVKGPLSREQIVSQIRKKRLGRHHELSVDAVHWERAGDIPGLFDATVVLREEQPAVAAAVASVEAADSSGTASAAGATVGGLNADWYYAKGRNNIGPVTADELRAMLATGRLLGSDRVWHSSLEDWTPAQDLPQFMGSVADPGGARGQSSAQQGGSRKSIPKATFLEVLMGTSAGASLPEDAIYKYPNLTRYLLVAEGALRILFLVLLLALTAGFVVVVGDQARHLDLPLIIGVVIGAGFALVLQTLLLWLIFISCLAVLEVIRILIKIEDNTSQFTGNPE